MAEPADDPVVRVAGAALTGIGAALVLWMFRWGWTADLMDPDMWWQRWAGERMWEGVFPTTNSLSWTSPSTAWVSHEPAVAFLYGGLGDAGLGAVNGLLVSAVGLGLAALVWRREHLWAGLGALLWALLVYRYGWSLRALTWGNLMLVVHVAVLTRGRGERRFAFAAAWVGLWAWVHGSFVVGALLLLLHRWRWGLAAVALSLLNPNGVGLWLLIAGYGVGSGAEALVHGFIEEWHPLWSGGARAAAPAAGLAAALGLLLTGSDRRATAVALLTAALAVRHQRYVDVAAIAVAPYVADRLAQLLPARPAPRLVPWLCLGFAALAATRPLPRPDPTLYPPALIAELPRDLRLWHDFRLGGWLGYHGVPVFFDPRNDCYPPDVLLDGFTVELQLDGWREVLDARGVDAVLTERAPLLDALTAEGWRPDGAWGEVHLLRRPAPPP